MEEMPAEAENESEISASGAEAADISPDSEEAEATPPPEEEPESGDETGEADADAEAEAESNDDEDGEEEDGENGDAPALPVTAVVEAVLFAAREPLKAAQIARAVGKGTRQEAVRVAIEELNVHYLETSRAFEIAEISGRYQLMSRPEFVTHIARIYPKKELGDREKSARLTPAALDTLSIIAYKQPVTRGEIEHVRGVGCGPVLRALIERGSVKVAGKRVDLVGQPLMYGTTEAFLAEFGLGSLDELPLRNEFLGMLGGDDTPPAPAAEATEEAPEEATEDSPEDATEEAAEDAPAAEEPPADAEDGGISPPF